ncbi:hypothetical protein [Pyrobaculum ferrireducens]|uniref:Uncharacterized protein n=1 Tax=Pyrobaculum ferrireducens TaxID=1104324 RepID=G7VD51_9CREN|nr:hypothetical protein [Pyrobaculum ferrireducens]AET33930.1 hypothetical protein P186_2544 [Pyrobaculum ferrireducens]
MSVFAAVALPVAAGAGPDPLSGVDVSGKAVNYVGGRTTPRGRIAALSHYDVLKTTEPLTCSDGAANFTCLLSKTETVAKAGATSDITEGRLESHYVGVGYGNVKVLGLLKAHMRCRDGDNGSPVYRRGWPIGFNSVKIYAYGVVSGAYGYVCFFSSLIAHHLYVKYA